MTLQEIKSKTGKYRILTVIIVSYFVVISLFITTFATIYFYSQDTFRSYFDYNSKIISDNIAEKYDENIENINTMVINSILMSDEIQKDVQAIRNGTESVDCRLRVRKQLETKLYDTKYLTEALIYVENKDFIIFSTGFCSTQQYFKAYARDNFSDYNEFLAFLNGEKTPKNLYSQKTMQMFSRRQYYLYKEKIEIGKIILKNDVGEFLRDFTDKNSNVVIFENEYVIASSDEKLASELSEFKNTDSEIFEMNGKLVYRSSMEDGRRKSFYVVDMEKMNEANKTYSIFIIVASMLCLLICVAACAFFVRFHYTPIKKFADFIRTKSKDDGSGGYRIFADAVDYIENNEKSTVELEKKERKLNEIHLEQWLLYKKSESERQLRIGRKKNSVLIVIKAEEYERIFFEDLQEKKSIKLEMANYVLTNILDEELNNCFSDVIKCRINDLLVWLVSFDDKETWKSEINEISERILNLAKEEFNISFDYYASNACAGMGKLLEEFDLLMVEIKQKNENTSLNLPVEGIPGEDNSYYYFPQALKNQLYDSIESGNSKSALMIVDNIINHNTHALNCEINNLKALAAEIYNTVIFRLRGFEVEIGKLFEENRLGKDIIMCEDVDSLEKRLKKFIESMCEMFYSGVNSNDSVYAKTRRYIYQHYKDPLLSSVTIAEELGLSRDYFLSIFKKESGMKAADYIHQIRIEEACKILEKTNSSIEKIALQVGYSNTKTFSRVFVKLKGVTPGAYRDRIR